MQLYFIRHGQSENNLLYVQSGSNSGRSSDPELTQTGRKQSMRLARFLLEGDGLPTQFDPQNTHGFNLTHLYTSMMVRATATASAVAAMLSLPLSGWIDLHEEGGIYIQESEESPRIGLPGKDRFYFQHRYPALDLPEAVSDQGWWNRPFEEPAERPLRARRVLEQLLTRHGDTEDRVAFFSHGGFFNQLMYALLEVPADERFWLMLNNCSISRIDFRKDVKFMIVYLNRVDFLPPDLITS